MSQRKVRNQGAVIPPAVVEALLAEGRTGQQVADYFNVSRETLYYRRDQDPAMKAAFERGRQRFKESGKMQMLDRPRETTDTGAELQRLLEEIAYELALDRQNAA